MDPVVSVIIPVHSGKDVISRCLKSCQKQTFQFWEAIVIENGKVDGETANIVQGIGDSRVRYVRVKQANRSLARNVGLRNANGKYIQFLDADDELHPIALKTGVETLDSSPNMFANICSTNIVANGNVVQSVRSWNPNLLDSNSIEMGSVLIRNQRLKPFDEKLTRCEDWLFWIDNLFEKQVKFSENRVGLTVNISGSNTMHDFGGMALGDYRVRKIILERFKWRQLNTRFLQHLIRDILLVMNSAANLTGKKIIRRSTPLLYCFCVFTMHTPFLSTMLKRRLRKLNEASVY
ncbi:glycosyltransferase family 2 protein [Lacticaseibacillus pantheris]